MNHSRLLPRRLVLTAAALLTIGAPLVGVAATAHANSGPDDAPPCFDADVYWGCNGTFGGSSTGTGSSGPILPFYHLEDQDLDGTSYFGRLDGAISTETEARQLSRELGMSCSTARYPYADVVCTP